MARSVSAENAEWPQRAAMGGGAEWPFDPTVDPALYQLREEKGEPDGYASLDVAGKVPAAQLPGVQSSPASFVVDPASLSGRSLGLPKFTRLSDQPLYSGSFTANNSIFWPWPVNMRALDPDADPAYRLYESTDHDGAHGGTGGIYVRYANDLLGPWTNAAGTVGARDLVYDSTGDIETPSVLYVPNDPNGRPWYLYHHGPGGTTQATRMVSSANGLTGWVAESCYAPNTAGVTSYFNVPSTVAFEGDGHTGYLAPFRIGNQFGAYHLLGGQDNAGYGMSWSLDGKRWLMDPRIIRYQQHMLRAVGNDVRVSMGGGGLVFWRGLPWLIGTLTDASSGIQIGSRKLIAVPLAWDLRTMLAPPTILLDPDNLPAGAWESTDLRSVRPFVDLDGILYVFYITTQDMAVGRVDAGV